MKATGKTFLVLCRRMWAARSRRDALLTSADATAYLSARRRADKLERIILTLELS